MTEKKQKARAWIAARLTNWAASIPGTIQDWKEIAKRVIPGGAAASAQTSAAKEWTMDNVPSDWLYLTVLWAIIGISTVSLARWAGRKRLEVSAAKRQAEKEAGEARREARTKAVAERLISDTWNVARDESEIHPEDARTIAQEAAERLVEEFVRQQPDANQSDPDRINRAAFIRWLVTHRTTERHDPPQPPERIE